MNENQNYRYEVDVSLPANYDIAAIKAKALESGLLKEENVDLFIVNIKKQGRVSVQKDLSLDKAKRLCKYLNAIGFVAIESPMLSLQERAEYGDDTSLCPICDAMVTLTPGRKCPTCGTYIDEFSEAFFLGKKISGIKQKKQEYSNNLQKYGNIIQIILNHLSSLITKKDGEINKLGILAAAIFLIASGWLASARINTTTTVIQAKEDNAVEQQNTQTTTPLHDRDRFSVHDSRAIFDNDILPAPIPERSVQITSYTDNLISTTEKTEELIFNPSTIKVAIHDAAFQTRLEKQFQVYMCQMGYAPSFKSAQKPASNQKAPTLPINASDADYLLRVCDITYDFSDYFTKKQEDSIKSLITDLNSHSDYKAASNIAFASISTLLKPGKIQHDKIALFFLQEWKKQIHEIKDTARQENASNAWSMAFSLLLQSNMKKLLVIGDIQNARHMLIKLEETYRRTTDDFSRAFMDSLLFQAYRDLENNAQAEQHLSDFSSNFSKIISISEKVQLLDNVQQWSNISKTSTYSEQINSVANTVATSASPDTDLFTKTGKLLLAYNNKNYLLRFKLAIDKLTIPEKEKLLASLAFYEKMSLAQHLHQNSRPVAALTATEEVKHLLTVD